MRSIDGTALLTIIAGATLLMFTTFMGQAQAFGLNIARCPCNFLPALLFAKKEVAKVTPAEFQACVRDIEHISKFLFLVDCQSPAP